MSRLPFVMSRRSVLATMAAATVARPAFASDLRFTHAYGETVLDAPASRVVSLGYTGQDALLALGLQPLAVRYWFGDAPNAIFPWAEAYQEGPPPTVLTGEVSFETVAALQPDLIVGIGSGISREEYALLSQIAPVIMHAQDAPGYGTPWDELTRTLGRATGRSERAEELVAEVEAKFAAARARHPEWAGMTAVAAYHFSGETGCFYDGDTRTRFLKTLGFTFPPAVKEIAAPEGFYVRLSPEDLSPLEADLLVWISSFGDVSDLARLPMRKMLKAHTEGREVLTTPLMSAAMSFGSVLSLPFALEGLEADFAAATDGDPATPVASATEGGLAP